LKAHLLDKSTLYFAENRWALASLCMGLSSIIIEHPLAAHKTLRERDRVDADGKPNRVMGVPANYEATGKPILP